MLPVLGRKVIEGEQALAVLAQAGDRLVVFGAGLRGEAVERLLSLPSVRGLVDRVQVLLGLSLQGGWQLVEHIRRLVHPSPAIRPRSGRGPGAPEGTVVAWSWARPHA